MYAHTRTRHVSVTCVWSFMLQYVCTNTGAIHARFCVSNYMSTNAANAANAYMDGMHVVVSALVVLCHVLCLSDLVDFRFCPSVQCRSPDFLAESRSQFEVPSVSILPRGPYRSLSRE